MLDNGITFEWRIDGVAKDLLILNHSGLGLDELVE